MFTKGENIVKIELERSLRVAGAPVEGTVVVDLGELEKKGIQEVYVELKGTVDTYVAPVLSVSKTNILQTSFTWRRTEHV